MDSEASTGKSLSVQVGRVVLAVICCLLVVETVLFAPLNADAGYYLRLARQEAAGMIPCGDIPCWYTPLATTVLALVQGAPIASLLMVQMAVLACALLTYRLARTAGYPRPAALTCFVLTWAWLLANEGRAIVTEPFAVACLLCAASAFVAEKDRASPVWSGVWVALAFWAKQYALIGWVGLLLAGFWSRRFRAALEMSLGVALGLFGGVVVFLALDVEPASLLNLVRSGAYSRVSVGANLLGAPEVLLAAVLTLATLEGGTVRLRPEIRVFAALSAAGFLPFLFRGYRHYWHFAIPFLVLLLLRPREERVTDRIRFTRRAVIALILFSVGLDLRRVSREVVGAERQHQREEAAQLYDWADAPGRTLYLVRPAALAWLETPYLASGRVGPRFNAFNLEDAEALLRSADTVVWDTSHAGDDVLLALLPRGPEAELLPRGFTRTETRGPIVVYSRPKS